MYNIVLTDILFLISKNEHFIHFLGIYLENKSYQNYFNLLKVLIEIYKHIVDYFKLDINYSLVNNNKIIYDTSNNEKFKESIFKKSKTNYLSSINNDIYEKTKDSYVDFINIHFVINNILNNENLYLCVYLRKNDYLEFDYYHPNSLEVNNVYEKKLIKFDQQRYNFKINNNDIINKTRIKIRDSEIIEQKLNVILVMSNVCGFKRRVQLAKEFILRMNYEKDVELYIVELAYDENPIFEITDPNNKKHLQLRTKNALWHKENMINIGVWKLLPENWKAFAWIDADIEFENETWVIDTLKMLNNYDIVQLFSHYLHMNKDKTIMTMGSSFGYKYIKNDPLCTHGGNPNFWHPGFAWAITRSAYEKINGLFQLDIVGGGDYHMAMAVISKSHEIREGDNLKNEKIEYYKKCYGLKLGYVPGVIRHYYHGSIKNRNYINRYKILKDNNFDFQKHITFDINGILVPTDQCPEGIIQGILEYFADRNEDDD